MSLLAAAYFRSGSSSTGSSAQQKSRFPLTLIPQSTAPAAA